MDLDPAGGCCEYVVLKVGIHNLDEGIWFAAVVKTLTTRVVDAGLTTRVVYGDIRDLTVGAGT
jgi:hypothetical protein